MIQDVMLKMIMEDLAAIKDKMDALIRTEETVRIQQKQIVAIFKKIDVQEKRIASTEAAITGNATSAIGGKGAYMRGDFYLTQGTVLKVLVGQTGTDFGSNSAKTL